MESGKMILEEMPAYYIVYEENVVATRSNVKGSRLAGADKIYNCQGKLMI